MARARGTDRNFTAQWCTLPTPTNSTRLHRRSFLKASRQSLPWAAAPKEAPLDSGVARYDQKVRLARHDDPFPPIAEVCQIVGFDEAINLGAGPARSRRG